MAGADYLRCSQCDCKIVYNDSFEPDDRTNDCLCGRCVRDIVVGVRKTISEFRKLADTPIVEPVRGLQVSRMHFDQWAEQLEAELPSKIVVT